MILLLAAFVLRAGNAGTEKRACDFMEMTGLGFVAESSEVSVHELCNELNYFIPSSHGQPFSIVHMESSPLNLPYWRPPLFQ